MEWYFVLLIIFGGLMVLMATGLPVALCFLTINIIGAAILMGGKSGLEALTVATWHSVATFAYVPVPMFILLGEIVFSSGMAMRAIDAVDKWLGRIPGRLGLLVVAVATLFSTMSGSTIATTAMLGEALLPEMKKRGYKPVISMGAIAGSGGLAMIIPPSGLAVVWASVAEVSIGRLLIAGIIPGLMMALLYATYIIGRCWFQPELAPAYEVGRTPLSEKIKFTAKYVLPLSFIVFMVTGLIFLGVATPSESAAMGVLGSIILALIYRQMDWKLVKGGLLKTVRISVMILLILSSSEAYSKILAFTGAARELTGWVVSQPLSPVFLVAGMMVVLLVLGCFMGSIPIIMIAVPLFMPIVRKLGFDPVWFGMLFLLNLEIGQETPPFGSVLFTMKGVAPPGTTMVDIIKADVPYLICDIIVMFVVLAFPALALWLPDMMLQA